MKLTRLKEAQYAAQKIILLVDHNTDEIIGPFASIKQAQDYKKSMKNMFKKYFGTIWI